MLLRVAVSATNSGNPASVCFPSVKVKCPVLGSCYCKLSPQLKCARRLLALWDECRVHFQDSTRSWRALAPSFFVPPRKLARIQHAGWKDKGNHCMLMGAWLHFGTCSLNNDGCCIESNTWGEIILVFRFRWDYSCIQVQHRYYLPTLQCTVITGKFSYIRAFK